MGFLRRHLWTLASIVAGACALIDGVPPDQRLFAGLGHQLVTGHPGAVYADPDNQAGPLQCVIAWAMMLNASVTIPVGVRVTLSVLAVQCVRMAVRSCARPRGIHASREATVALAAVVWTTPYGTWGGHPVEALVPVAWVASGVLARRDREILSGLVLALGVAVAPWAVLGAPVLLTARRVIALRAAAVAGAASILAYLPFVFTGHFQLFAHRWLISGASLVHLVDPSTTTFTWWERLVQAVLVLVVSVLVARRTGPSGIVLAPMAAATARVLTDPMTMSYYWVPVGLLSIGVVLVVGDLTRRAAPAALALTYLPWLGLAAAAGGLALRTTVGLLILCVISWVVGRSAVPRRGTIVPSVAS